MDAMAEMAAFRSCCEWSYLPEKRMPTVKGLTLTPFLFPRRKLKTHKKYVCSTCWLPFDIKDHKCNEQYCVVEACHKASSGGVGHKHDVSCVGRGESRKQGELTYLCGLLGVAPLREYL